jgi:hypothetical protein
LRRICLSLACSLGPVLAAGCQVDSHAGSDASSDRSIDANVDMGSSGEEGGPGPDADVTHCTLFDGSDPVAFCTQKVILQALHSKAFDAKQGVAESWSATTGRLDTNDAGVTLHDWHDDVAYGAACALYHASATLYGDTTLTATLDADLAALGPILEKELTPLPAEYTGETYQRLRVAGVGLNVVNYVTDSQKVLAIADAYGEAIYTEYFFHLTVPPLTDAGAGDAAVPAEAGLEAGSADAAVPTLGGVIGTRRGSAYAYAPADVATAAYALIDLASRYPKNGNSVSWQRAAQSALQYIYERGRDPVTGLYFTGLVTSSDAGHDAIDTTVADSGTLLADTTVTVALALSRAQDLVNTTPSLKVVASYPFSAHVNDALAALNGDKSLSDTRPLGDGGTTTTGFLEGYVPASQSFVSSKPTRSNAYALAAIHRQFVMVGTLYVAEVPELMRTLVYAGPPHNSSLFTVLPAQNAFLRACTRSFQPLSVSSTELHPESYQSRAVVSVIEGLSEQLYGMP